MCENTVGWSIQPRRPPSRGSIITQLTESRSIFNDTRWPRKWSNKAYVVEKLPKAYTIATFVPQYPWGLVGKRTRCVALLADDQCDMKLGRQVWNSPNIRAQLRLLSCRNQGRQESRSCETSTPSQEADSHGNSSSSSRIHLESTRKVLGVVRGKDPRRKDKGQPRSTFRNVSLWAFHGSSTRMSNPKGSKADESSGILSEDKFSDESTKAVRNLQFSR